jgi:exodeoxyribonuclease-3
MALSKGGAMRIVAWNCNMALDRKFGALLRLRPDIAIISECAEPGRLFAKGGAERLSCDPVWIGRNPHKGLAVLGFNGYAVTLAEGFQASLRYIAPVKVSGAITCNLLAAWAQNASAGLTRKRQSGPLRRALARYRGFLAGQAAIVAGDLNNNVIWHRPGWRMNHGVAVEILKDYGLVSAYHAITGEAQGSETLPTLYWRDRRKDGPTYHIDYVFLPESWVAHIRELGVGSYEDWCGAGLSDHVPVVVDIDLPPTGGPEPDGARYSHFCAAPS